MGLFPKPRTQSGLPLNALLALVLVVGCGPGLSLPEQEAEFATQEQSMEALNSLSVNGLSVNGLSVNGLSVNGLSVNGLTDSNFASWFEADAQANDEVMRYLVRCAVPQGQVRIYISPISGVVRVWQGALGVAPRWASGKPATVVEQQVVSACLAAHVNTYGYSVPISITGLKGDGTPLDFAPGEKRMFGIKEACFFGNLFTDEGIFVANDQLGLADNLSSPRRCGLSHRYSGYDPACPVMRRVGTCRQLNCKQSWSDSYYTECTYNGVTYRPLTTRLRDVDIYVCGDGVCQVSERCGTGRAANNCGVDCGRCPTSP
jgi:hypothetical protein